MHGHGGKEGVKHSQNEQVHYYENLMAELQDKVTELKSTVERLEEQHEPDKLVFTFKKNKYTPDVHKCVHKLLELNIVHHNVGPVIEAVLDMIGVTANHLPSESSVRNMNIERLVLSQEQIKESLLTKNT